MSHQSMSVAERLADLAIRVWQRDKTVLREIARLVTLTDGQAEYDENDGIIAIKGKLMNTGLFLGLEPPQALLLLGFGLFGPLWVFIPDYKEAHKIVMRRWREEVRRARQAQQSL